jgi:hypothetical protein
MPIFNLCFNSATVSIIALTPFSDPMLTLDRKQQDGEVQMTYLIFSWVPLALLILAYHITWPKHIALGWRIVFDSLLVVLISLPGVVLATFSSSFIKDASEYLEARMWLPYSIPLWMTITAIPLVLIAAIIRRFVVVDKSSRQRNISGADASGFE